MQYIFTKKTLRIGYKTLFALLGFSALVTEVATLAERSAFNAPNFFSFFTVEVNILMVVTFLLSAFFIAYGKPEKIDALRGFAFVNILIVGIGFFFLLQGLQNVALTAVPWDNVVLHYIIPIVALLDLVFDPPKRTFKLSRSFLWLLLPIGYLAYSLIRGSIVGWYPYPFLNIEANGLPGLVIATLGLTLLGVVLVFVTYGLSKIGTKRPMSTM